VWLEEARIQLVYELLGLKLHCENLEAKERKMAAVVAAIALHLMEGNFL
jgi:hypothetical protein